MGEERNEIQIRNATPTQDAARLISFGHSNHDWPAFVALLRGAGVTGFADVRSSPYSGRYPYFNREPLMRGLREVGIDNLFLGDLLVSARPIDGKETPTRSESICVWHAGSIHYK